MKVYSNAMIEYINESPTPYHAVGNTESLLQQQDAVKLDINKPWHLEKGTLYYVVNKETSIASFCLNEDLDNGFRIAAAHTDSPCFKVKPVASIMSGGYEKLNIEGYGGSILHTWLDRPLSIAGVVYVKDNDSIKKVLVNIDEPLMIIPSVAIHLDREINENAKFNIQTELCPLFAQQDVGSSINNKDAGFMNFIASEIGYEENSILSFDLMAYDSSPGVFFGQNKEFISSPRIDDLSMVYCVFTGYLDSILSSSKNTIALAFDHEECGSQSDRGAKSNFLNMILDRIHESFNRTKEQKYISLANSFLISGDMAHASHPSYQSKNEPNMPIFMNKGPVLKHNFNQSYATSAEAAAFIKVLCLNNSIPLQEFSNRSDTRGGSTLGPMLSAEYGITAVDIGNPMLAMHSARELCGSKDPYYMKRLFEAFFLN